MKKKSNAFKHIKLKISFAILFVLGLVTVSSAQTPSAPRSIKATDMHKKRIIVPAQRVKTVTPNSRTFQLQKAVNHFFATHQEKVNQMKKNNPRKYQTLLIDAKKIVNLEMDLNTVKKTCPDKVAIIEAELQELKALYNL